MSDTTKAVNGLSALDQSFAITGLSCRLPGASSVSELWEVLRRGESTIRLLPGDRFPMRDYWHPRKGEAGKFYVTHAGTLDAISAFDASFFGLSSREARQMDPQQRLLLELAWEAMESAGKRAEEITHAGVYIGASSTDYANVRLTDPATSDGYFMTGNTLSIFANRISYVLGLSGPSLTIDTACSSSLFALHAACTDIALGRCDSAFVGGVNMLLSPYPFIGFCAANMLSPTGLCQSFGAGADGYVRSEGGAMLLIRPLATALKAGDHIYAVIRGGGVNSDGRTAGLSYPGERAQAALLQTVYERAEVTPDQLSFVEAHGTGTPVGDPIEAAALGRALGQLRKEPLLIGSVKSNVGHLEPASGMVSVVKSVLALQNRILPRSLHAEHLNPNIAFQDLNLAVAQQEHVLRGQALMAGINNFGFGGANAHFILSNAPALSRSEAEVYSLHSTPIPLLLAARSTKGLQALAQSWSDMPLDTKTLRGAATHRTAFSSRLAVLPGSIEAMRAALTAYVHEESHPNLISGQALAAPRTLFVFAGNGTQFPTMGTDLLQLSAEFAAGVKLADAALQPHLGWSVEEVMRTGTCQPEDPEIAQPLLFAFQVGIVHALAIHGVHPNSVVGHSVGEIVAAYCAGALGLEEAARIVVLRSRHQAKASGGGMVAVRGEPAQIKTILDELTPDLDIAAYNAPGAITLAGTSAAIDALELRLQGTELSVKRLPLVHAYHSHLMEPVAEPLLQDLGVVSSQKSYLEFVSSVTGTPITQDLNAEYWWRNVREPVRFEQAVRCAVGQKPTILIEITPRAALQYYMRAIIKSGDVSAKVLTVATAKVPERDPFPRFAANFYVAGGSILSADAFSGPARIEGLPGVPWQRTEEWYEPTCETLLTLRNQQHTHPLLSTFGKPDPTEWYAHLDTHTHSWLSDHVVSQTVVLPAACLLEFAFTVARFLHPKAQVLELRHFEIFRPLVLDPEQMREIRVRLAADGIVTIESRPRLSGTNWTVHAQAETGIGTNLPDTLSIDSTEFTSTLDASTLYERAATAGLQYGPHFQKVGSIQLGINSAYLTFVGSAPVEGLTLDPTVLDGAFQGLIGIAISHDQTGSVPLPRRIGRIRLRTDASCAKTASIQITLSGKRETQADFCIFDTTGKPYLSAQACWFTRMPEAVAPALCERSFHEVWRPAPLKPAHWPEARFLALRPVLELGVKATQEDQDAKALLDAFLTQDEHSHSQQNTHSRIWQSLFLDSPEWLPAALLAAWIDEQTDRAVASSLNASDAARPDAMLKLLLSGRAAMLAAEQIFDAIAGFTENWPQDRPLRILELHAERGILSHALAPRLSRLSASVDYTVLEKDPDQLTRLRADLLPRLPGIIITDTVDEQSYDVIVSFAPGLHGYPPASLLAQTSALVAGGILLVCEAADDVAWTRLQQLMPDLVHGITAWRSLPHQFQAAAESALGRVPFPFITFAAIPIQEERKDAEGISRLITETQQQVHVSRLAELSDTDIAQCVSLAIQNLAQEALHAVESNAKLLVMTRDSETDPVEAARAALVRTIANEYPALCCRQIDIASTVTDVEACIIAELETPDQNTDVRWDTTGRYVKRLREGLPAQPLADVAADTVRLVQPQPGSLTQLQWVKQPSLAPKGNEVAIRVQASGLNYRDVLSAIGLLPDEVLMDGFAGATLGMECAGVIEAVGDTVQHLVPGQRVMALSSAAHASRVITDAASVMVLPDDFSMEDAATLPVAFLTALHALETVGQLQHGETILIHGAAGGVGLAALQYATYKGARVIATAGTAVKRAALKRLGIELVFDSRTLSFADDIMKITQNEGVDIVLNALSGPAMERSLELVRPFGRFLELGKRDFLANSRIGLAPLRKNVSFHAIDIDALVRYRPAVVQSLIKRFRTLLDDGALGPLPHTSFSFANAQDAFALMRASGHVGKVVLTASPVETPAVFSTVRQGTVIITGGTGGFAGRAAVWLAQQGVSHIALVSRRGENAENSDTLKAEILEAGASSVSLHACDITEATQLKHCLDTIRATYPPIVGIIHAAAVVSDALLSNLTDTAVKNTVSAKLLGAFNLDKLTRADTLEFFLFFSSATITLGAPGQGAYEAANAAAEALLLRRKAEGLPGTTVRWGPIADAGLLARNEAMRQALDRRLGVRSMSAAMALADLPALMASSATNPVLADMRWQATVEQLPIMQAPLFSAIPRSTHAQAEGETLIMRMAQASESERLMLVIDLIQTELVRIMQADRAALSVEQSLADLGMDSLTAMELVLGLERQLGVTLPGFAWQDMTINHVAHQIVGVLGEKAEVSSDEKVLDQHLSSTEKTTVSLALKHKTTAEPLV